MERTTYDNGELVPLGVISTTGNCWYLAGGESTDVFTANKTSLRVTPTAGGVWIATGASPTATAEADDNHYVSQAQDFIIDGGEKLTTTGAVQITRFK